MIVRDDGKTKLIKYIEERFIGYEEGAIYAYILKNPYKSIEAIICINYEPYDFGTLEYEIIGSNFNFK